MGRRLAAPVSPLPDAALHAGPARPATAQLQGDLAVFNLFDSLQLLLMLRLSGLLWIDRADGESAFCRLAAGTVVEARRGHLEGREALIDLFWWREGAFRFQAQEEAADPVGEKLRVEEVMLDAVRISDELHLRSTLVPPAGARLALSDGAEVPASDLCPSTAQVFAFLAENPGLARTQLEAVLPFAAEKVRLALAQLVEAGCLDLGRAVAPSTPDRQLQSAGSRFAARFPAGLRLLVAHSPQSASATELQNAARALAEALGVPDLATAASPVGPSFLRFRPPGGALLSLTFLPLSRRNRFLFETLAGLVDGVLLCGWKDAEEEAAAWTSQVPPNVDFEVLEETRAVGLELVAAVRRLTGGEIP